MKTHKMGIWIFLMFLFFVTQTSGNLKETENVQFGLGEPRKDKSFRLPNNIIPKNYQLTLWPNLDKMNYQGNVTITFDVVKETKNIILNSHLLNFTNIKLTNVNNTNLNISSEENKKQILNLSILNTLVRGIYKLHIQFKGGLDKKIVGFYESSLKNGRKMAASKFQPTYARQAFPCFDEPEYKATYDITLVKPLSYIALSNMNAVSSAIDKETNTEAVTFATSVPMSTYLACFVICDFDHKETTINAKGIGNNFTLRAFGQKNETHKIDFALDIAKRATEFYVEYYKVPFPLPKLDMIAIPDYVSGATEHWGLITYRETSFLVDEAKASAVDKLSVANTIAHELAHMWFGNLVTMKWWDEIWLNEGFATYMQVKALNAIEPSWGTLELFLPNTLQPVLVNDAKLSSHPIVQTVETPDQITAIFDTISYNKGSSILRMLEGFIGEENFRQGISNYLEKYKYGNTVTQELLSCLEPYLNNKYPNLNLSYIMDTWTRQMGYPVVNVAPGDSPNTYVLTQSRFLLDPTATYENDSPFNYRWFIPITYKTSNKTSSDILWFPDSEKQVTLTLEAGESLLKINNNQVGYYRVNYTKEIWDTLAFTLNNNSDALTVSDRAHILGDVFALAEAGHVPYGTALTIFRYISTEKGYAPWVTANTVMIQLSNKLGNSSILEDLKKYSRSLVEGIYKEQSWTRTDMSLIERLYRKMVITFALRSELPEAENKVKELLATLLENKSMGRPTEIDPDLRDVVYVHGMKKASQADWDKLWQIYLKEGDVQLSSKFRIALAAVRDTSILEKYLTLAWDENYVRSQDYLSLLQHISANPSGTILVWNYVKNNWPQLVNRFTLNNRNLGTLIPAITKKFNSEDKLKEMEDLFARYPAAGAGELARRSALETVRNNIKWNKHYAAAVADAIKANTCKCQSTCI